MKHLQKVSDVHRMLIDFLKKQDTIIFGRFLGRSIRKGMRMKSVIYVEGKERKDA